jgi:hypothetical protein
LRILKLNKKFVDPQHRIYWHSGKSWADSIGNVANSLQYTVASPVSQQPMTPAILSAITSPALHHHTPGGPAPATQSAAGNATAAQASAAAAAAAGGQLTAAAAAAAYPYSHLPPIDMSSVAAAGLVDWSGLTYTLPAGMYAL